MAEASVGEAQLSGNISTEAPRPPAGRHGRGKRSMVAEDGVVVVVCAGAGPSSPLPPSRTSSRLEPAEAFSATGPTRSNAPYRF
jgi:hypothetical protein